MKKKLPNKHNPMAKDLRQPKYKPRILNSKKKYKRNNKVEVSYQKAA